MEDAARTDRLEYLHRTYIEPVQLRILPIFDRLREQRRIKDISPEVFYFLLTSGGSAPYGQAGLVSLTEPRHEPVSGEFRADDGPSEGSRTGAPNLLVI